MPHVTGTTSLKNSGVGICALKKFCSPLVPAQLWHTRPTVVQLNRDVGWSQCVHRVDSRRENSSFPPQLAPVFDKVASQWLAFSKLRFLSASASVPETGACRGRVKTTEARGQNNALLLTTAFQRLHTKRSGKTRVRKEIFSASYELLSSFLAALPLATWPKISTNMSN